MGNLGVSQIIGKEDREQMMKDVGKKWKNDSKYPALSKSIAPDQVKPAGKLPEASADLPDDAIQVDVFRTDSDKDGNVALSANHFFSKAVAPDELTDEDMKNIEKANKQHAIEASREHFKYIRGKDGKMTTLKTLSDRLNEKKSDK